MAVREVLDKVLAEPIKPHFVIANVGKEFPLSEVSKLVCLLLYFCLLLFPLIRKDSELLIC